jgi:hypothetical protein
MRCTAFVRNESLVLCIEDVPSGDMEETVKAAFFQKEDGKYVKKYPSNVQECAMIQRNFPLLAKDMFTGEKYNWEKALTKFAGICDQSGIRWYVTGSSCEAVRGMPLKPHDIDVYIHTEDFYSVRDIFSDCVIEPFSDLGNTWAVRYFGRLCIEGVMVDIAADDFANESNHKYDIVKWNGYDLLIEPFEARYKTEVQRQRPDRIEMIEKYMGGR